MKILLCSHTGVFQGGAERSLLLLAESLSKSKLDYVINIPDSSKEFISEIKKKNLNYVTIHKDSKKESMDKISFISKYIKVIKRLLYIYELYHFIKSNQIDILYLNTLRTSSEYIAAKIAGKKTVMHIRGFDTRSNFRYIILRNLDKIIVLNRSAKRTVLSRIKKIKSSNVHIIPNGVQIHSYNNNKECNKTIKIINIGGYEYRKGIDYFFNISYQLLLQFKNVQIFHIGDPKPKDQFSKSLFKKYAQLFRNKNYIELGLRSNVMETIDNFDIFLMTSRSEGMPRSLLEAMERGLLPIVSNIHAFKGVIFDSKNGFIINLNDLDLSLNKIKSIIKNIDQHQIIQNNARRDVENKYNIEKINQQIIDTITIWDS